MDDVYDWSENCPEWAPPSDPRAAVYAAANTLAARWAS